MATETLHDASLLPASELISRVIEDAFETIRAARDVLIERHSFNEFSYYLERLLLVLQEILTRPPAASVALAAFVDALRREIKAARALASECGKKNRLYLLLNCRRIVKRLEASTREISRVLGLLPLASLDLSSGVSDEIKELCEIMERVEFRVAVAEEEILEKIESGTQDRSSGRAYANSLLALIADAMGIPKDSSLLKQELDEFRSEIEDTKLRKDLAEAMQMEQIIAFLSRADAASSFEEKKVKHYSKRNPLGSQPLEPLESFCCPITRDVMEEPVETSSRQTFERKAIEKWFADGNSICPLTMVPLDTGVLRPNNSLRKAIEEWKERNTIIVISSIKSKLEWCDEQEVIDCLRKLQELCEETESDREYLVLENYLPILVGFLSRSNSQIRSRALSILWILAKDSYDNKGKIAEVDNAIESIVRSLGRRSEERKLSVALLLELSKNNMVRGSIGKVQGCILLLVTTSNNDSNQAANDAKELLENLSFLDENVVQMAKANYFKPLLRQLDSGSDDAKKIMVSTLAEMELTDHSKGTLFKDGALQPLLKLISHTDTDLKVASVKALQNLSSLPQNALQMIREGAVRPLLHLLHHHISSFPTLQEQVAATIMNIAVSAKELDSNENFVLLESDDDVFWLLSLINFTGPNIQRSILITFCALCELPTGKTIRAKLRQCSAIQVLISHCERNDRVLRANAVKLLSCLTEGGDDAAASETFLKTLLSIVQVSVDEEEKASALSIISDLCNGYLQTHQWLVDAEAIPIIIGCLKDARPHVSSKNQLLENAVGALCHFTMPTNLDFQKRAAELGVIPLLVQLLGYGTALTKKYAATSLAQFSESSPGLSSRIRKHTGFFCCSGPQETGCPIHMGICSVVSSFCLLEADAVGPLVRLLTEMDPKVCEASLRALSTLIEGESLHRGYKVLSDSKAILPMIKLLSLDSSDLQLNALHILERIFTLEDCQTMHGTAAQMPLVDITQRGTGPIRALAARVLAHLNVLHDQSSYF
ncbi:putative U box domain, armadillo-like helical, Zinc finger, RING/FYVE/PHD-type [Dioscorea sansibarensis]